MYNQKEKTRLFTALRDNNRYHIIKFFGMNDGAVVGTNKSLYTPLARYMLENHSSPNVINYSLSRLKDMFGILIKDEYNRWALTDLGWIAYRVILAYEEIMENNNDNDRGRGKGPTG